MVIMGYFTFGGQEGGQAGLTLRAMCQVFVSTY